MGEAVTAEITRSLEQEMQAATGLSDAQFQNLQRRARSRTSTLAYIDHMVKLFSPLHKHYARTRDCFAHLYISQALSVSLREDLHNAAPFEQGPDWQHPRIEGGRCEKRWCTSCNRIQTAERITRYMPAIEAMPNPHMVTLTVPNVPGRELAKTISSMGKALTRILSNHRASRSQNRKSTVGLRPMQLLRKMECTYNARRNDFHPHLHLVINDADNANFLLTRWLRQHPTARAVAQDARPADAGSLKELFKYFTKVIQTSKGSATIYPRAIDCMFTALRGKQVFKTSGIEARPLARPDAPPDTVIGRELHSGREIRAHWDGRANDWKISSDELAYYVGSRRVDTRPTLTVGGVWSTTSYEEVYEKYSGGTQGRYLTGGPHDRRPVIVNNTNPYE